jgi:hypothetical protein
MNSEPIGWSVEKQQHLQDHLTGFWAEDTWLFTSKQGKVYQMNFSLPAAALQAEIKYALHTKFESGRWKTNGNLSSMCRDVKAILQWLNQLPFMPSSLMQKPLDHWEMALRSSLVQILLANSKVGKDTPKKVFFLFPVGNINHLSCLRKIERPFKNRIRQQYHGWDWANKEVHMNQQPLPPIIVPCEDPITHVEANGFECDEADCICHWERRSQEQDYETGTHAPDCRCGRCEPDDSPYEPYYSRSDQERDQATADYYDEQQRRNSTQQCSDGSWW